MELLILTNLIICRIEAHGEIFRMIHELPGSDQDAQKPFGGPNPWPSAGNLLLLFLYNSFCYRDNIFFLMFVL